MARGPQRPIYYVYLKLDFDYVPRYVGKGHGRRYREHENFRQNPNRQMRALCDEARARRRPLPTVILAAGLSEADAHALEVRWIAFFGRGRNGTLYNWTDGGEGISGHIHSPEARARCGTRGPWTAERLAKFRQALASRTPEQRAATRAKQAAAKAGKKQSPETVEKRMAHRRGQKRPPEWGQKISAAKMGHAVSQETRDKISATKRANRESQS